MLNNTPENSGAVKNTKMKLQRTSILILPLYLGAPNSFR